MVINILLNNKQLIVFDNGINYNDICTKIEESTHLQRDDYYLVSNGKRLTGDSTSTQHESIHCMLRQVGGKGGFGSMLRAIGAQIEKTTNREACRDLSGRRLRDINEEKRVRAWLGKQAEREREREERKKRKIEKLLAVPKHDFKDEKYEEARANLTDKVSDAFEEGLKQAEEIKEKQAAATEQPSVSGVKRKAPANDKTKAKKNKKGTLWIGDDISGTDTDDSDSSSGEEQPETKKKVAIKS
ncbi:replication stress response regulator SDE2 [Drosophila subobscura]|uniref:replication stress response regulator SDE2 n=1 Tax=Drosophila subobscura TaxID=7241 RepID=UPI00155AB347|nr:replication stress response regulator SDE2 [Drosophila subobscura]